MCVYWAHKVFVFAQNTMYKHSAHTHTPGSHAHEQRGHQMNKRYASFFYLFPGALLKMNSRLPQLYFEHHFLNGSNFAIAFDFAGLRPTFICCFILFHKWLLNTKCHHSNAFASKRNKFSVCARVFTLTCSFPCFSIQFSSNNFIWAKIQTLLTANVIRLHAHWTGLQPCGFISRMYLR